MPIWLTIVIGIAASIIAGLLIGGVLGFILAVIIAAVLVALVGSLGGRSPTRLDLSTRSGSRPRANVRTAVSPQSSSRQMYVSTVSVASSAV